MRGRTWLIVAMAALAVASCGERAPPGGAAGAKPAATRPLAAAAATGATRAAALEAELPRLRKVDAHRAQASGGTLLGGYFDQNELKLLDETVAAAGRATLHNRYYFEHGALFYFRGEAPAGTLGGGPAAIAPTLPLRAEFAGARVLAAVRVEHYGEVKLEPAAIEAIRRQAAELAGIVTSEAAAPTPR